MNNYKRTIVKHDIPSRYLPEGFRSVRIYLPPGYQPWMSYPVIYCQDGEDFFNFGRIATQAQQLILEQDWDPFIVVGVDVDKTHRTSEYSPDGERHAAYVCFFAEELIPWVENNYSVRDVPLERLLAGDSLGATVCVSIALAYPRMFNQILSLSGAFYDVSQAQLTDAQFLHDWRVWMIVGLQETAYQTDRGVFDFVTLNRETKQLLESKGATVHYQEKDGEHKWGFWQSELTAGLRIFVGPKL